MTLIELRENKSKRRDKLVIMTEIIGIAKKGALKTQIKTKANLSSALLIKYLSLLEENNLLERFSYAGREIYKTTPKGIELIKRQQEIAYLLNEDECKNRVRYYPFEDESFPRS
jgi:predicted transcriptional regulator